MQVCGVGGDAAIGLMAREWNSDEAILHEDDFIYGIYECVMGDKGYHVAQVVVANQALTLLYENGGDAASCMEMLGKDGLTFDQIRWIFSSYTEEELTATGWDPKSIVSDGDDSTHLWSELNEKCVAHPINVVVPTVASDMHKIFHNVIITDSDNGETIRYNYMAQNDDSEVFGALEADEDAIGFAAYSMNLPKGKIAAAVNGVKPSVESISKYQLGRPLYMNLRVDETIEQTAPYVDYGINSDMIIEGFVPLSEEQYEEAEERCVANF